MALSENLKLLMRCIADNDMQSAKKRTLAIANAESSDKNIPFCNSIKSKLQTREMNTYELPSNLRGLLKVEDVSVSFNENRYYLSERERSVYEQVKTASEVNSKLAEMGIRYTNTSLLYGESGTGKTTFGRYIAYKHGLPFAYLNFSNMLDSYIGGTSKNIDKVFEYIKTTKCVLMLDEIDAIGIKRDSGKNEVGEMSRVVISLMQALDLIENDTVIIAATNRFDMLDSALVRRFTLKHEVKTLQTDIEVCNMITTYLNDVGVTRWNAADLDTYVQTHKRQSDIINDVIAAIISMIKRDSDVFKINK